MQTLPVAQKNIKAFYCTMYDTHGTVTRLDDEYVFMSDAGDLTVIEMEMFPWIQLHGEIGLADTQRLLDDMRGGYAKIACTRNQEAA